MRGYGNQWRLRLYARVRLFVRDLEEKRLELSTPNLVHIATASSGEKK